MDITDVHVPRLEGSEEKASRDLQIAHSRLLDEAHGSQEYTQAAEAAQDEDLKKLLQGLAADELEHAKKLTEWIEGHKPKEEAQKAAPKLLTVEIAKVADNTIYGIVLRAGIPDLQGDIMGAEDIQKACHVFMEEYRVINADHSGDIDACPVECWIAKEGGKLGNREYGPGDWLMGTKINDPAILQGIREGKYRSYSIEGEGVRVPLES